MKKQKAGINIWHSFCIAVSMYSRLPAPMVEWTKDALSLALCFFPVVGLFVGAAQLGWWHLSRYLGCGSFLTGAVGAWLPILITGGIHMDGFMDTSDALNSYGSREKKLEILKDAHLGAFAVIRFGSYILLYAGLYAELMQRGIFLISLGYLMSRAWSAVGFVTLRSARESGSLYEFAAAANRRAVIIGNSLVLAGTTAAEMCVAPVAGLLMVLSSGLIFLYYKRMAYKQFGGITGDLAGYFLQLCEIAFLVLAVVVGLIHNII